MSAAHRSYRRLSDRVFRRSRHQTMRSRYKGQRSIRSVAVDVCFRQQQSFTAISTNGGKVPSQGVTRPTKPTHPCHSAVEFPLSGAALPLSNLGCLSLAQSGLVRGERTGTYHLLGNRSPKSRAPCETSRTNNVLTGPTVLQLSRFCTSYTQQFMQFRSMTRPARIEDTYLADQVRSHMDVQGLSIGQVADMIAIDKSTLSRSLKASAFSRNVRQQLKNIVDPVKPNESVSDLVRKALCLMSASDRLRERADQLLIKALDQSAASK